jgi:hypothetical protein
MDSNPAPSTPTGPKTDTADITGCLPPPISDISAQTGLVLPGAGRRHAGRSADGPVTPADVAPQVRRAHVAPSEFKIGAHADRDDVVARGSARLPAQPAHVPILVEDLGEEAAPPPATDTAHD